MNLIQTPKKIAGLTIDCDRCPKRATHRSETKAELGYDVHWTCDTHTD